jgi:hypothetical protein
MRRGDKPSRTTQLTTNHSAICPHIIRKATQGRWRKTVLYSERSSPRGEKKEEREATWCCLRMFMGGLMGQAPNLYIHMYLATY